MIEQHLILGDSIEKLKELKDNSIDLLATDPSYGLHFMGKDWDKTLPPTEIFTECYRILKPGSFIAVMSSPRSDLLYRMIQKLEDAGFDMSFSPLLWTYHTGFPKASDTSKMIDKRFGAEREVVGKKTDGRYAYEFNTDINNAFNDDKPHGNAADITEPSTDLAKKYEGSKLGFQPKPAVEHIIIGMKPHKQKSYIDNVLNFEALPDNIKMTYPFLQVPKPAKKEKDFGLTGEEKKKPQRDEGQENFDVPFKNRPNTAKNIHATVKPIKLMSYIITLFTREGDWVIDPFLGSGTTGLASKLLNRNFIGVEREEEYFDICNERLSVSREELIKFFKDKK
jgi:site-specific DNA-methyltransferase (adenine-specific)